jgi:hypothetical protein
MAFEDRHYEDGPNAEMPDNNPESSFFRKFF